MFLAPAGEPGGHSLYTDLQRFSEYRGAEEPQALLTWGEREGDSPSGTQVGIYYLVAVKTYRHCDLLLGEYAASGNM